MSAHPPPAPCEERDKVGPEDAFNLGGHSPESGVRESQSGPHRRSKSSSTAGSASPILEKEKRKRSRVTPEQLVHLERFFAADRSPTAVRRKEISDYLGMQERQTQIWFQIAKAKTAETRGKAEETPPTTPPPLSNGYEPDLQEMLHEDHDITIIPCNALSVGTWRRVVSVDPDKRDLVAYICEGKQSLTWFVHSGGHGFKMEIAFDSVVSSKFTNLEPGKGVATFDLSRPPKFFMETIVAPVDGKSASTRAWKVTPDWTEHQQATRVLHHVLTGPAMQLSHILRHFDAVASGSEVQLTSMPALAGSPPHAQSSSSTRDAEMYTARHHSQRMAPRPPSFSMPQVMAVPSLFPQAPATPSWRARGAQPMTTAPPPTLSSYATPAGTQYIAPPRPPMPSFGMSAPQGNMDRLLAEYGPLDTSAFYMSGSQPVSPYSATTPSAALSPYSVTTPSTSSLSPYPVTTPNAASLSPAPSYGDEQQRGPSPVLLTQPFYPRESSLMLSSTAQLQPEQAAPQQQPESPSGLPGMAYYGAAYGAVYGDQYARWS